MDKKTSTSTYHYISGTLNWANKLAKPDEKYNNYQATLIPDEAGEKEYKKSGLDLTRRDDGSIVFRRPTEKLIKGELVQFAAPNLVDKDGQPLGENVRIGNGSKATIKVVVYKTPKGLGHRLEAVRIDELVHYEGASTSENF